MKPEIIRDKTLDWFERVTKSPWLDRICVDFILVATGYFVLIAIFHILYK